MAGIQPPLRGVNLVRLPGETARAPLEAVARNGAAAALAQAAAWGGWPAAFLVLPLLLGATGADAATINIPATCTLTGSGVCDDITFNGGVLTLNGVGKTYAQQATLSTSSGNTLNQDGQTTTFTGVFSNAS